MSEGIRAAAPGSVARKPEDPEAQLARARERREALRVQARAFGDHLHKTPRLPESDRRALVRNLGRLMERRFPGEERATATRIFRRAFGEDAALSMDKKRKRFMRFDGEPLPEGAPPGEYSADGRTFLALIRAFAEECGEGPDSESAWRMLTALCARASFAAADRPTLASGDPRERFQDCMAGMLDRLARNTDVIPYLGKIRQLSIRSHPHTRDDLTPEQHEGLPRRRWLPWRFEHERSPEPFSRGGLDVSGWDEPSDLLPQIRLARIYWPRFVLCLPVGIETSALGAIDALQPAPGDLEPFLADPIMGNPDPAYALRRWRRSRKQELLREAMREKGLDPARPEWDRFLEPFLEEALEGATWQRFYQARSYDLILAADGEPENLKFGIHTADHWTHQPNAQRMPEDDAVPELKVEVSFFGELVVLPVGGRSMICRPLIWCPGGEEEDVVFEELLHPMLEAMRDQTLGLETEMAWRLLSMPMSDWRQAGQGYGGLFRNEEEPPCLRPCFAAPEGWAPAPEGSLAAAMMRGLAHGRGPERLDELLAMAINARVACLADMEEELEQRFRAGLRESGYGTAG